MFLAIVEKDWLSLTLFLHFPYGVLKKMGRNTEADQAFATAAQLSDAFQQKSYRDQDADARP